MNAVMFNAFQDELEKIAFKRQALEAGKEGLKWLAGKGKALKEGTKARSSRAWQGVVGGPDLKKGQESALEAGAKFVAAPIKSTREAFKRKSQGGMGLGEKGLTTGLLGLDTAHTARAKGRRGEAAGQGLGGAAALIAGRRTPLLGNLALYTAASRAGGSLGRKATGS